MFVSKRNKLIYPQSEHLKLAGVIASHWGNEHFEKPPVPYQSFVNAVSNHDSGYGHYDVHAVGELTEDTIISLWTRCTHKEFQDPYEEIITKRHFMRMASYYPAFSKLAGLHDALKLEIDLLYAKHGFSSHIFDVTDSIMNLCDSVSFSFCREEFATHEVKVFHNATSAYLTTIHFTITANRSIILDPYPLDDSLISGAITAYDQTAYPNILLPNEIRYQFMNNRHE